MAGLFDFLSAGPSSGGLLDFLSRNSAASIANNPGGLPSDMAQYGSSVQPQYGSTQQPQYGTGSPVPQNPPPVISAQPSAAPASAPSPSYGSGLGGNLLNPLLTLANSRGLIPALGNTIASIATGQRMDPTGIALQQQGQTANLTAHMLMSHGYSPADAVTLVQPGNTQALADALKQISTQGTYTQETDKDGNVWNKNRLTGERTIAYQPRDDKFSNVEVKDAMGNVIGSRPFNQKTGEYGPVVGVPPGMSGPPIPKVLGKGGELYHVDKDGKVIVDHKNVDSADATLSDDAVDTMATQYLAGDKSVLQNLGRGAQGAANIVKLREAIAKKGNAAGLDGNGIAQRMIDYVGDTARERTAATQEGRMAPAGFEAAGALNLARQASAAVPRGNWVPVNKAVQFYEKNSGDPAIRAFGSANTTLINTYARAINPNGIGTVADKEHAREMLSTADSPAAYEAVLQQLEKEIQMAHNSPAQARESFKADRAKRLGGTGGPATFPDRFPAAGQFSASGTTGKTANGVSWGVVQ